MTDKVVTQAQRRANSYKSPSTFMDGFNYGLEIADRIPTVSIQIEITRLKQQHEYTMQQNMVLLQKLKDANDKIEMLNKMTGAKRCENVTLDDIASVTCEYFHLSVDKIKKRTRETNIRLPRQIISYIGQVYATGITVTMIGNYFNQDHTTHVHAKRAIGTLYKNNENIRTAIDSICYKLFTK